MSVFYIHFLMLILSLKTDDQNVCLKSNTALIPSHVIVIDLWVVTNNGLRTTYTIVHPFFLLLLLLYLLLKIDIFQYASNTQTNKMWASIYIVLPMRIVQHTSDKTCALQ